MSHVNLHEDMQPIQLRGGRTIFTFMIPFLHHTTYSLSSFHFFTILHIHFHDSISSPLSLHFFSFTIHQHLFSNDTLLHFASYVILACFINITKGLSYALDSLWFPVSVYIIIEEKRTENEMNVVNTRTNILCIHDCHTRTNHKKM